MTDDVKILCTICARAGSKGVQNKNVRVIAGKPLISHTVHQALKSGLFEHVIVSTDSDEIASIANEAGAEIFFKRPAELASDHAGKISVIRHALVASEEHYGYQFDSVTDLDVTSPLRSIEDILLAHRQFFENKHGNLITAAPARRSPYFNMVEVDEDGRVFLSKPLNDPILRRQDSAKCYDMNASIYIWKRDVLLEHDSVFLDRTGLFVMPEERSIDIDSPLDFKLVEFLMNERHAKGGR